MRLPATLRAPEPNDGFSARELFASLGLAVVFVLSVFLLESYLFLNLAPV